MMQPLAQEGDFPYSILLGPRVPVSGTGTEGGRLIISIPQEVAQHCLEEVSSLLRVTEGLAADITVALLANEIPPLPFDGQWHPGGAQVLLDNISDPESCAIVMLDSPALPPPQVRVVPGAGGMMSPLWLLQRLSLPVLHNALITYRLNLAAENPALAAFFQAGMAAVGVQFDAGAEEQVREVFSALETLVRDFPAAGGTEGPIGSTSKNYMAPTIPGSAWIEEEVFILLYLLIAVLVLALLSGFSFLGKRGSMNRRAFFKLWYLIPVIILLSTLFLWLGQEAVAAVVEVVPGNATLILGTKTLLSFIIVSLPFIFLFSALGTVLTVIGSRRATRINRPLVKDKDVYVFLPAKKSAIDPKAYFAGFVKEMADGAPDRVCVIVTQGFFFSRGIGKSRKYYFTSRKEADNIIIVRRHYYYKFKNKILVPEARSVSEIY